MRLEFDQTSTMIVEPIVDPEVSHEPTHSVQEQEQAVSQLTEGIRAARGGDRQAARQALLRAVELDPGSEAGWLWLSSISEYPEELLSYLNKVLEINPSNERAVEWAAATNALIARSFVQRGVDASESDDRETASAYFRQAIEHDPANTDAWHWLASLSPDDEQRLAHFEKVLEIEPENAAALSGVEETKHRIKQRTLDEARAEAVAGRPEECVELLNSITAEYPEWIEAWMLKAHAAADFNEKLAAFRRVIELDPEHAAAKAGIESIESVFSSQTASAADAAVEEPVSPAEFEPEAAEEWRETESTSSEEVTAEQEPRGFAGFGGAIHEDEEIEEISYELEEAEHSFDPISDDQEYVEVIEDGLDSANHASDFTSFDDAVPSDHDEQVSAQGPLPAEWEQETDPTLPQTMVSIVIDDDLRAAINDHHQTEQWDAPNTDEGEAPYRSSVEAGEAEFPVNGLAAGNVVPFAQDRGELSDEKAPCPFCEFANEAKTITCPECRSVLTLSDLELLLANQNADKAILRQAVAEMEREAASRELDERELISLAIGHLNLRNLQFGYNFLRDASQKNLNNVVLSGQVNTLLIRLEEIKEQEATHNAMSRGKTILVVDDSPTVRKLISGKLEKCGHEVHCTSDGDEAIERLESVRPDLILLDINMPRMDGYQTCKLIRSNPVTKDVPVVMISGKDGFFDKVRGRMVGTSGYITKPFGPEALMKVVEFYLNPEA